MSSSVFARRAGVLIAAALVVVVLLVARSYRPADTPYTPHSDDDVLANVAASTQDLGGP